MTGTAVTVDPVVRRLRLRGTCAAGVLLTLVPVGIGLFKTTPGLFSCLMLVLGVICFGYMVREWKAIGPGEPRSRDLAIAGVVLAIAITPLSAGLVLFMSEALDCPILEPNLGSPEEPAPPGCTHMTTGEWAVDATGAFALLLTLVVCSVCVRLARRSPLAGRLAIPFALAGHFVATDTALSMSRLFQH